MSKIDEIYADYLRWCAYIGFDNPLSPTEYEKAVAKIPNASPNNTDAILRNNNRDKDR